MSFRTLKSSPYPGRSTQGHDRNDINVFFILDIFVHCDHLERRHRRGAAVVRCRREKNGGELVTQRFGLMFKLVDETNRVNIAVLKMANDHVQCREGHANLSE